MPNPSSKDPGRSSGRSADQRSANRKKTPESSSRPALGSLILFWPFLIFHALIKPLPKPARIPLRFAGDLAIAGLYAVVLVGSVYYLRARPFDMAKVAEMPQRTIVYDRRGVELGRIHGEKRDVIDIANVSQDFILAIVAREDKRFYKHGGVDWFGVGRAIKEAIKRGHADQGASTLTMQLARNTFPLELHLLDRWPRLREVDRKLLEVAVAYRIEAAYPGDDGKQQILQHYLNRIFLGHNILGLEEASRTYFEKSAKELTLSESALLAGIVRGPNQFSPFKTIEGARHERDVTLNSMVREQFITAEQAEEAKKEPINIRPEWRRSFHNSYAMDAITRELDRILEDENIEMGGLKITTTIDSLIQKKAEEALDTKLRQVERSAGYQHQTRTKWKDLPADTKGPPQYIQGSLVAIENLTGGILAVVGGRDADESKFNRALQGKRQLGSVFKPFVYVAGFDVGIRPDTLISDARIARGEIRKGKGWSPDNSDGKYGGLLPASVGLIRSRNTMSVRVGNKAGIERVAQMAKNVGFSTPMPETPISFLGAWEATTEEVAAAYTVFPNAGQRCEPRLITEIRDRAGNVLYENKVQSKEVTRPGSTWAVSNILREVTERGTAAAVKSLGFTKPCGGKTGTTNDFRDAWFAGYTSSITCAVWVGLDTPKKTIDKGYGSTLALPIWVEVMKTADKLGYKAEGIKSQLSFAECRLCRESALRATAGCEAAGTAYTDSVPLDSVPAETDLCDVHPARAVAVNPGEEVASNDPPPRAQPVQEEQIPRALPVSEDELGPIRDEEEIPLKGIPVEDE